MVENTKKLGICLGLVATVFLGACGDSDSAKDKDKDKEKPAVCTPADCTGENEYCDTESGECKTKTDPDPIDPEPIDPEPPACEAPNKVCGTICTDVQTDSANCGDCGAACLAGQVCENGACKFNCAEGQTACEDGCYDLQEDPNHCGQCEIKCNTSGGEEGGMQLVCKAGSCIADCGALTACESGCADLMSDNNNCGECGIVCKAEDSMYCTEGVCKKTCPAGESLCDDSCFDLDEDVKNCGECGHACTGTDICIDGVCGSRCAENETLCGEECVDLQKSKEHCGTCEIACEGDFVCGNGLCVQKCPEDNQIACDGSCIDPKADLSWCGASGQCTGETMGTVCSSNASCTDGACVCPDDAPDLCKISERETVCVDSKTSDKYCGCTGEQGNVGLDCTILPGITEGHCDAGVCALTCESGKASCDDKAETGCETDITTVENCGACGNTCSMENASETACVLGVCKPVCKEDYVDCNGKCIALDSDAANCGFCGNACHDGESCTDGFCQIEECGDDGYVKVTVSVRKPEGDLEEKEVKAYCINDLTMFKKFQSVINSGGIYPNSDNVDQAYILMNNLSLGKLEWASIGTVSKPFSGLFLGNGYTIVGNLTTKGHYTGLFGYVKDAVLNGLNLMISVDGSVDTKNADHFENLGGLVGYAENSIISRTIQKGTLNGDTATGGLVGYAKDCNIEMIRATTTVNGMRRNNAGVLGYGNNVKLRDITSDANVDIKRQRIYEKQGDEYVFVKEDNYYKEETGYFQDWGYAGLAGRIDNSTVDNCHVSGTVGKAGESMHGSGGMIGWMTKTKVDNCSSTATVRGAAYMGGLIGYGASCDVSNSTYNGKVTTSWHNGGLMAHLSDGTITNCSAHGEVAGSTHDNGGILGYGSNVTIKDCFSDSKVSGNHGGTYPWNGGLAGRLSNSKILNSTATGDVKGTNHVGGLLGSGSKVTIENCRASGNVTNVGTGATYIDASHGYPEESRGMFGGLVGYLSNNSKVIRSVATGNVTGHTGVGGLVGGLFGSTVEQSEAFGNVTGNRAGGLIGITKDTTKMTTCAAIGDAKGEGSGSLVGYLFPGVHTIKNVYGTGAVSGARNIGALFGQIDTTSNNSVSVKTSYYWKNSVNNDVLVGAGAEAFSSKVKSFEYDANKEAVVNEDTKLVDALGDDNWVSATCTLSSGPGAAAADKFTLPVIKALGVDVCK